MKCHFSSGSTRQHAELGLQVGIFQNSSVGPRYVAVNTGVWAPFFFSSSSCLKKNRNFFPAQKSYNSDRIYSCVLDAFVERNSKMNFLLSLCMLLARTQYPRSTSYFCSDEGAQEAASVRGASRWEKNINTQKRCATRRACK